MSGDVQIKKGGMWARGVWIVVAAVAVVFAAYLLIQKLPTGTVTMEVSTVNTLPVPSGATESCGRGGGRDLPVNDLFCCKCVGSGRVELHFDEPLAAEFTICSACEAACLEEFGDGVAAGASHGGSC